MQLSSKESTCAMHEIRSFLYTFFFLKKEMIRSYFLLKWWQKQSIANAGLFKVFFVSTMTWLQCSTRETLKSSFTLFHALSIIILFLPVFHSDIGINWICCWRTRCQNSVTQCRTARFLTHTFTFRIWHIIYDSLLTALMNLQVLNAPMFSILFYSFLWGTF